MEPIDDILNVHVFIYDLLYDAVALIWGTVQSTASINWVRNAKNEETE
jgi:hypothetical protein